MKLILVIVSIIVLGTCSSSSSKKMIDTSMGTLRANVLDNGVVEALNIPFAKPPVKELRFSRPREPVPWKPNILDATKFGPMCVQREATKPISEDCLQLNIWTPSIQPNVSLPVYVWSFGGGLVSGSGINFNGTRLSSMNDIVVVTLNYRLGALGTYASMEIAKENDGATGALNSVLDILQACRWVRDHIAAFGGDPKRIVLGGESSGSVSSSVLAFSNLTGSILSGLVLESGVATGPWFGPNYTISESLEISRTFARELVGDDDDGDDETFTYLNKLRDLDVLEIMNSDNFETLNYAVDSYLIHDDRPRNLPLLFRGNVLIGGNNGDTTCRSSDATPQAPNSTEELENLLGMYFFEDTKEVLTPYLTSCEECSPAEIFYRMSRDAGVICPASRFARRVVKSGQQVFTYLFSYNASSPTYHVWHGGEVHCIFQNTSTTKEKKLCEIAGQDWGEFIKSLDYPSQYPSYRAYEANGRVHTISGQFDRIGLCESFWAKYISRGDIQESRVDAFGYLC